VTHGFIWDLFAVFFIIMYFMLLWFCLVDLFRDHTLSGWAKFAWILGFIFFFYITILVYLIARGKGMQERAQAQAVEYKKAQDDYIKSVSGSGSADEIEKAHQLLTSGAITQAEFDAIKAKALAS
jgi:hypothetical protein